jgi:hypothetical protein
MRGSLFFKLLFFLLSNIKIKGGKFKKKPNKKRKYSNERDYEK